MITLSIIIPHYDIPDLLDRCINSIPDRDDIQIIVVDDGSKEREHLREICPGLSRGNVELVLLKRNRGAGHARNIGISNAKGKWITFIDSDDLFSEQFTECLNKLVNREEDIVYFRSKSVLSSNISIKSNRNSTEILFDKYRTTKDETELRYRFHTLWGKVFKSSFIYTNDLNFNETRWSNDVFFSCNAGVKADKICVFDEIMYINTEREGSLAYSVSNGYRLSAGEYRVRLMESMRARSLLRRNHIEFDDRCCSFYLHNYYDNHRIRCLFTIFEIMICYPLYIREVINRKLKRILSERSVQLN